MHRHHGPPWRCVATGKAAYRRAGDAWRIVYALWHHAGAHLRPYRCPFCGCWHLSRRRALDVQEDR